MVIFSLPCCTFLSVILVRNIFNQPCNILATPFNNVFALFLGLIPVSPKGGLSLMDLSYSSWITYWSGTSGNNRGLFSTALSHIFSYTNQEQFSLTKYLLLQLFHTSLGLYSNQEHTTETMGIFSLPRCIFLGSFIHQKHL